MSTIHVRSVPEEVLLQLQARARDHQRSMEAEVRVILAEAMLPQPVQRGPRHVNFDLIAREALGDVELGPMQPALGEVEL